MSRVTLAWVVAVLVVILVGVVTMRIPRSDESDAMGVDASIREYGRLGDQPSAMGIEGVENEITGAVNGDDDSSGGQDGESTRAGQVSRIDDAMTAPEQAPTNSEGLNRAADAYRVSSRSPRDFDREFLMESGFDEAKIEKIAQGLRSYAKWLRDSNGGELPPPPIKQSPEDREAQRQTRENFLSDEEYDAALAATGQNNAAVFANLKEGSEAWNAGIRSGDRILEINGVSVFGLMDFADGRNQGVDGGMHVLVVERRGEQTTLSVACCRPGWGPVDPTIRAPSGTGSAK